MHEATAKERIGGILLHLTEIYGEQIGIDTFFPKYKSYEAIPLENVLKVEKLLNEELTAARALADRAVGLLTMREKLLSEIMAAYRVIEKTPAPVLDAPVLWSTVRNAITLEVRDGLGEGGADKIIKNISAGKCTACMVEFLKKGG